MNEVAKSVDDSKYTFKYVLKVTIIVLLCFGLPTGGCNLLINLASSEEEYHFFDEFPSPNREYMITILARYPEWPFGSQDFKITVGGENFESKSYETKISNDGGSAYSGKNVNVSWTDDSHAIIILDGQEQKPETVTIIMDTDKRYISIQSTTHLDSKGQFSFLKILPSLHTADSFLRCQ